MSKCKYLSDTGICKVTSDGEVSEPCIMGPCGKEVLPIEDYTNEIAQTAAPRFSKAEREAINKLLQIAPFKRNFLLNRKSVYDDLEAGKINDAIATVRAMLQEVTVHDQNE